MNLEDRIHALVKLGEFLAAKPPELDTAVRKAYAENRWFIPENSYASVEAIRKEFLDERALGEWVSHYDLENLSQERWG